MFVLPSKFPKFAIQSDDSGHNEVDIIYQGRTCMEHCGVLKITNSYNEREETRTNTKHSKWLAQVMWIKLSNGSHHSLRVYTQFTRVSLFKCIHSLSSFCSVLQRISNQSIKIEHQNERCNGSKLNS